MRNTQSSPYGGGGLCSGGISLTETAPGQRPQKEHGTSHRDSQKEHGTSHRDPPEGTWDQAARQELPSYRDHPVNRMAHASENITLPQTSFVGSKNTTIRISHCC